MRGAYRYGSWASGCVKSEKRRGYVLRYEAVSCIGLCLIYYLVVARPPAYCSGAKRITYAKCRAARGKVQVGMGSIHTGVMLHYLQMLCRIRCWERLNHAVSSNSGGCTRLASPTRLQLRRLEPPARHREEGTLRPRTRSHASRLGGGPRIYRTRLHSKSTRSLFSQRHAPYGRSQ